VEINMEDILIRERKNKDSDILEVLLKGKEEYVISHDKYTGDWCLYSEKKMFQEWHRTKQSAINSFLKRLGVIDDPDIELAPDRTSA